MRLIFLWGITPPLKLNRELELSDRSLLKPNPIADRDRSEEKQFRTASFASRRGVIMSLTCL